MDIIYELKIIIFCYLEIKRKRKKTSNKGSKSLKIGNGIMYQLVIWKRITIPIDLDKIKPN